MKYKLEKKIVKKGFPTSNKHYSTAHEEADTAERKRFPKGYEKMKRIDDKIPKGELVGKNTRNGRIEVSSKVPNVFRKEVAFHERQEHKNIERLKRK